MFVDFLNIFFRRRRRRFDLDDESMFFFDDVVLKDAWLKHMTHRDKRDFHLSTPRILGKGYKGIHLWNSLPESLKLIQFTTLFKSSLMVFLLTTVWTCVTDLCTFVPFCTLHFALNWFCVIVLLQWVASYDGSLCLSSNPPLYVVTHSFHSCSLRAE